MPFAGERMTDLFIPIGRAHSRSSTVQTESYSNTPTATVTIPSGSTTPTTVSSHKSIRNSARRSYSNESPLRYTITGPTPDRCAQQDVFSSDDTHKPASPSNVHVRRNSDRTASPSTPIKELTMRLSMATGSNLPDLASQRSPAELHMLRSYNDQSALQTSTYATAIPIEFTTPEKKLISPHVANTPNSRVRLLSIKSPSKDAVRSGQNSESNLSNISTSELLRSHSQSSSRSDRSCPPPSFPSGFYEKGGSPGAPHRALLRSSSTRSSTRITIRSRSPLKHEIRSQETEMSMSTAARQKGHRRYSSDTVASKTTTTSTAALDGDVSPFHATIHQYATCPHKSPPATRPLNAEPTLDETYSPPRSIIPGSCFECDTGTRRDEESSILLGYNPRIASHTTTLTSIIRTLETISPISPMSPIAPTSQFQALSVDEPRELSSLQVSQQGREQEYSRHPSYSSDISEDVDGEAISIRIQVLEDRIAELTMARDKEVKAIWRGYTERWGPGTLGVLRGIETDRMTLGTLGTTPSSRISLDSERSVHSASGGRMRVDWIRHKY